MLKYSFILLITIGLICTNSTRMLETASVNRFGDAPMFDPLAISMIQAVPGNVFTVESNGGFVLSQLYPGHRVSIDTWHQPHGQELLKGNRWAANNPETLLKDFKIAVIPVFECQTVKKFGACPGWGAALMDNGNVIFLNGYSGKCKMLRNGAGLPDQYKKVFDLTAKEVCS